jgi:hypothetical protein
MFNESSKDSGEMMVSTIKKKKKTFGKIGLPHT